LALLRQEPEPRLIMGRNVRERISYTADVAHLGRLREAISIDNRQSIEWKHEIDGALLLAIRLLSTAKVLPDG